MTTRRTPSGHRQQSARRHPANRQRSVRPTAAYHQRGNSGQLPKSGFTAPELWHESHEQDDIRYLIHPPGNGYCHAVTIDDVRARLLDLPRRFVEPLKVVQFSTMTRKRKMFPYYGMQWGSNIYLYPIEMSLVERYYRPPTPQQIVEAKMFGGIWSSSNGFHYLTWTETTIKDFYLNNVLIHELGHILDNRNTNHDKRERFANWFAVEYGFRSSRGRK